MFQIKLNKEDRKAIDWIGNRYSHGYDLKSILLCCEWIPDNLDWDSDESITFLIPENKVWEINDLIDINHLDCIDVNSNLSIELSKLINSIV